ncbi:probable membrane-associated kinase regulator 4 [Henckelia pumila]|uniref:probable membrane-associated kinase regulator 4 n=1 Tax=Henckelia pumila TaxID=405737 RepID=UPI003C6DF258
MKMAKNLVFYDCEDEEYIEMVCCSTKSSPQTREFEFQMSESTIFPADELFYKGKLLPLYLPRRLPMLDDPLLHGGSRSTTITPAAAATFGRVTKEHDYYTLPRPLMISTCSSTAPCTNSNTPLDSCNISPSESFRASCELNPDDYFFEWSAELSRFVDNQPNKKYSWCKKLMKHSVLGQKLRSSRNYLKSLFRNSACSNESCAKAKESHNLPKTEEILNNSNIRISKNKPVLELITRRSSHPTLATLMKNMDEDRDLPRRSFSRAIKKRSTINYMSSSSSSSNCSFEGSFSSSSSSFSSNSNGFHELEFLRRSRSVTEIHECSIEAAIAHCKKSHKIMNQEI